MKFLVVLHKDTDSDYGVTVPDIPGCFSSGFTVSEALENVHEALSLHFEGLIADRNVVLCGHEVGVHAHNLDFAGGVWALIDFDVTAYLVNPRESTQACPNTY